MTTHPITPGAERSDDVFRADQYPLLPFDEADWQWFEDACSDLEIPVDAGKRQTVTALYSHLVGVNGTVNLTRITQPLDYLKFHVLDSLTVLPLVESLSETGDTCVDLGSGGGYPGLPLMTWCPERDWVLVDSKHKKVLFLNEAVKLTPCVRARALALRGREVAAHEPGLVGRGALVLARAVGSGEKILPDAAPFLRRGGFVILLKGPGYDRDERRRVKSACREAGFEYVDEPTVALDEADPERRIVLLSRK
jgi:16S rRNA (guanine527-N7)-methyltransferase